MNSHYLWNENRYYYFQKIKVTRIGGWGVEGMVGQIFRTGTGILFFWARTGPRP
jgi:hypothetical protein